MTLIERIWLHILAQNDIYASYVTTAEYNPASGLVRVDYRTNSWPDEERTKFFSEEEVLTMLNRKSYKQP